MQTAEREPVQGDAVVVDDPRGAFHGMYGRVVELDADRRPLPWVRVQLDPAPQGMDGRVLFTATELVVLGQ